jgi:hypothetical protein
MAKRDLINEIREKNSRSTGKYLHGKLELSDLKAFSDSNHNEVAHSLIIMGLASCIEVSVKEAIKKLIDYGEPFLSNADGLIQKFDFSLTKALSFGQITFGDLISHSISVSNLEHISSHFERLIKINESGDKFDQIISSVKVFVEPNVFGDEDFDDEKNNGGEFIINDSAAILSHISRIFELRHIVAHEASFDVIEKTQLEIYIESTRLFLEALYELVEQRINPGISRNAFNSSIQALEKTGELFSSYQRLQDEIYEKIKSVRDDGKKLQLLFENSRNRFEDYYEAERELRLELHGMLTGNAMRNIESNVGKLIYSDRINYLIDLLETVEFHSNI